MIKKTKDRSIIYLNLQETNKVFAAESVVIQGRLADDSVFFVDVGRLCYLERSRVPVYQSRGKPFTPSEVSAETLSKVRVKWFKSYLNIILHKGWRDETVRGRIYYLRYFFDFCDFDGGIKPTSLDGLLSEYRRFQNQLYQLGRLSTKASLGSTAIMGRLQTARMFIQWAFNFSDSEMVSYIPIPRNSRYTMDADCRNVNSLDAQKFIQTCAMCFYQLSTAILDKKFPINVTVQGSKSKDFYWYAASKAPIKILNYNDGDEDFLSLKGFKKNIDTEIVGANKNVETVYNNIIIRRREWREEGLTTNKTYVFNLCTYCFYHLFLSFTGGNVQPVLDLKVSEIDIDKIGVGEFAFAHKYRAGRKVGFTAPRQLMKESKTYLKLREWAFGFGFHEACEDFLFVKFGMDGKLMRQQRSAANGLVKKSPFFRGVKIISPKLHRQIASDFFVRKSSGKISLVARKLNNSIATVARSYTGMDVESQAMEMNHFYGELAERINSFNRSTDELIPVEIAKEGESQRTAVGSCNNLNGSPPLRAKGFNDKAPEPKCGTFETCLFCEHFAVHTDLEDMHKLLSLRKALSITSDIRNDLEHYEEVVQPMLYRIDEIVNTVFQSENGRSTACEEARDNVEMGYYNEHWARLIQSLLSQSLATGGTV
ncbi:Uncharacterised protein [Zhongshania aliphaticivorans]|uniref:Core-binding (CB) domain-containing protein n=1 Tax=Zhongshania aliphaticivorans TaxID=1470434 RepID=A0A5S9NHC1_9GAMM|nr:hypothetical protein [Zhongshania aliphaticivorans]CAA0089564.1 Uncharacterised protein [Zhongshania aliphaticivorans]